MSKYSSTLCTHTQSNRTSYYDCVNVNNVCEYVKGSVVITCLTNQFVN